MSDNDPTTGFETLESHTDENGVRIIDRVRLLDIGLPRGFKLGLPADAVVVVDVPPARGLRFVCDRCGEDITNPGAKYVHVRELPRGQHYDHVPNPVEKNE